MGVDKESQDTGRSERGSTSIAGRALVRYYDDDDDMAGFTPFLQKSCAIERGRYRYCML
jgi:hypothetical protein